MPHPFPSILGNKFASTVIDLGAGTKGYETGERVVKSDPMFLHPANREWGGWQKSYEQVWDNIESMEGDSQRLKAP